MPVTDHVKQILQSSISIFKTVLALHIMSSKLYTSRHPVLVFQNWRKVGGEGDMEEHDPAAAASSEPVHEVQAETWYGARKAFTKTCMDVYLL